MTWSLTSESFEKLLTWLDSNREEAATKYEKIRLRLIKYFICNGCGDQAEDLADETLNRLAKRLDRGEIPEPFTGDKMLFPLAFARIIRLENLRKSILPPEPVPPDPDPDPEALSQCLDECVRILSSKDRLLTIEYFRCEKSTKVEHRKQLATKGGYGLPGLRTRIHRNCKRLRPCIEECIERLKR